MINFEEELKKFHPSLEVEDAEEAIYNQDLTDMADILVKMINDVSREAYNNREAYNSRESYNSRQPVHQEAPAKDEEESFEE